MNTIGPVEGWFIFNGAGRALKGIGQGIIGALTGVPSIFKQAVLTTGDVGGYVASAAPWVSPHRPESALFQAARRDGIGPTAGAILGGVVHSAVAPFKHIHDGVVYRRPEALGEGLLGAATSGLAGVVWGTRVANAGTATNRGARQFSGGAPSLEGSAYNADVVNARSADIYRLYGDNPLRGTMSNVEARQWYLAQDAQILNRIDSSASLGSQARQAFDLRNANRTQARDFMSDRVMADRLIREEPNMTWNQMLEYQQRNKGLTGDDAYRSILRSAPKTRASVNKQLGVE